MRKERKLIPNIVFLTTLQRISAQVEKFTIEAGGNKGMIKSLVANYKQKCLKFLTLG